MYGINLDDNVLHCVYIGKSFVCQVVFLLWQLYHHYSCIYHYPYYVSACEHMIIHVHTFVCMILFPPSSSSQTHPSDYWYFQFVYGPFCCMLHHFAWITVGSILKGIYIHKYPIFNAAMTRILCRQWWDDDLHRVLSFNRRIINDKQTDRQTDKLIHSNAVG